MALIARRKSFKVRLTVAIGIINMLVILTIALLDYRASIRQLQEQTKQQTQQTIEQLGTNVSTYMDELYRLTLTPYYNNEVLSQLEYSPKSSSDWLQSKRTIESFLANVMTFPRDEVLRVYLVNEDSLYSYTRTPSDMPDITDFRNSSWYKKALQTTQPVYVEPRMEPVYGERQIPVFSIVRQLRSKKDNHTIGVVKVDASYSGISRICDKVNLNAGGQLLLINSQRQILYSSGSVPGDLTPLLASGGTMQDSGLVQLDGNRYLYNTVSLPGYSISIVALHSYQTLMAPLSRNLLRSLLLAVIATLLADLGFAIIINRFTRQLFEVISLMHLVQGGDLTVRAQVTSDDEIGYLARAFNHMTDSLQENINRNTRLAQAVYQAQYLAKEAQYNSLCSQIRPHFLYNTLNTISLLIKCEDYENAIGAIESFSAFLGGVMTVNREISLGQELTICRAYCRLVGLRYQDRLTSEITVASNLLNEQIPSLSIQPLIENAVKYACEQNRGKTCIRVTSRQLQSSYIIEITDNGPGICPEELRILREKIRRRSGETDPPSPSSASSNKIGLVNIARRLDLKYQGAAKLEIISNSKGTSVQLILPYLHMNKEVSHVSYSGC